MKTLTRESCDCKTTATDYLVESGYVGRKTCAVLDLREHAGLDEYVAAVVGDRAPSRCLPVRMWRKARRLGYEVRPFALGARRQEVADIHASMPVRQGKPMWAAYATTADEIGGSVEVLPRACRWHWRETWGAFVDGELHAYVSLLATDRLVMYSRIMGHGDHLHTGMMYAAHFALWEYLHADPDVDLLLYSGWRKKENGLQKWKRRLLFGPTRLTVAP